MILLFIVIDVQTTSLHNDTKCCHMVLFSKRKSPYIDNLINITDVSIPLYSPSCILTVDPDFTPLASILADLAYLTMLFILQLTCTASSIGQLEDKEHWQIRQLQ